MVPRITLLLVIKSNNELIQWGVVIGASLIAAVIDIKNRRIPNRLCGPLLLIGLIWSTWQNGFEGLAEALTAMVVLALPFILLFLFTDGGAGDAKLMGAIGACLGLRDGMNVLAAVCIAGLMQAGITALIKGKLKIVLIRIVLSVYIFIIGIFGRENLLQAALQARPQETEKMTIPYGVSIFIGLCLGAGVKWLL